MDAGADAIDDAWEVLRRVGGASSGSADAPAVVDLGNPDGPSHAYSYSQLWRRCATAAAFFGDPARHGAGGPVLPGDRIAALFENCPAFLEMHFAAAALRATLVNLNFRLAAPELGNRAGNPHRKLDSQGCF